MSGLDLVSLFLLGISSVLPLINPVGTALIIDPYFSGLSLAQRKASAATVAVYAFLLGTGTLFLGSWCLKFMGISVSTTQLGGGLLIARMGISLLNADPSTNTTERASKDIASSLFYPLAFPLTVGPGCISAVITLSAHAHANELPETFLHMGVLSASLLCSCFLTYLCFAYSSVIIRRIGTSGSLILNRLSAFLVFCIGVQMAVTGIKNTFPEIFLKG